MGADMYLWLEVKEGEAWREIPHDFPGTDPTVRSYACYDFLWGMGRDYLDPNPGPLFPLRGYPPDFKTNKKLNPREEFSPEDERRRKEWLLEDYWGWSHATIAELLSVNWDVALKDKRDAPGDPPLMAGELTFKQWLDCPEMVALARKHGADNLRVVVCFG